MNKLYLILGGIVVAFLGASIYFRAPDTPRLGMAQDDHGGKHVKTKAYGGNQPPTSGDHADPIEWGYYDTPQPDVNTLHNLEHGGIYVSYTDELSKSDVKLLKALLFKPFSDKSFQPLKVIMAPRPNNDAKLILSSWNRSLKLNEYNKQTVIDYYKTNLNMSPEPLVR